MILHFKPEYVPGNLKRLIDRLLNPTVPWQTLLRQALVTGLGKSIVSSWRRPSRKHAGQLPGIRKYTTPTVWPLIDTSGSIGGREIQLVLTEVYAIAKLSPVNVICWDVDRVVNHTIPTLLRPSQSQEPTGSHH